MRLAQAGRVQGAAVAFDSAQRALSTISETSHLSRVSVKLVTELAEFDPAEAFGIARTVGDNWSRSMALSWVAARLNGVAAPTALSEAEEAARTLRDHTSTARAVALGALAQAHVRLGRSARAEELFVRRSNEGLISAELAETLDLRCRIRVAGVVPLSMVFGTTYRGRLRHLTFTSRRDATERRRHHTLLVQTRLNSLLHPGGALGLGN